MSKQKAEHVLRTIIIFIVLMALCYIGGFAVGRVSGRIRRMGLDISAMKLQLYETLNVMVPVVYCGINLLFFLAGYLLLFQYIRRSKDWDGEDEQYIKAVENGFSKLNNLAGIIMIINLLLFVVCLFLETRDGTTREFLKDISSVAVTVLAVATVLFILMQSLILRYVKRINPEKRGNLFALNFQKIWMASCDEAEQMILFRSGYKAYRSVNVACIACICALFVLETVLQVGLVPIVLVGVIWLTNAIAFARENRKLDK
ncbi:MAG: DUF3169 family protein [Acetatifactor sp.]|nr:DUF3169 family protein [Acetatifactor sp.]